MSNDGIETASTIRKGVDAPITDDEAVLAALGRKDLLRRNWGFWNILGFAVTNLCSWEFATSLIGSTFTNGGPVAVVYGFITTFFGILAINASLAEMASMYPVAGGQYFWTFHFAPPRIRVFLSYFQGWLTSIAWQVGFVSTTVFLAEQIEGLIVLNHSSYVPKSWHTFLLMIMFSLVGLVMLTLGKKALPVMQTVSGITHIVFFLVITIVLLSMSKKASSEFVWTKFVNNSGWSNNGVSFCIGLLLPAFSISGADGCVHMSEEVRNASLNIPRAFVYTLLINGTMAFAFMVVSLYCITDLDTVLDTPTGFPIIQIFYQATNSKAAATIMDVMMMTIQITCSFCLLAAASRLAWSFSREGGFPGAKTLAKVDPRLEVPLNAIYLSVTISIVLSVIVIGSSVALEAIVSLCTLAAFMSYTLPIGSFLWFRLTQTTPIAYGPWKLGRWGVPINIFALCWCIFFVVILPFPSVMPVTAEDMNYAGPIAVGVFCVLTVDWMLRARYHYFGPKVEITLDGVGQEGAETTEEVAATKEKS
ncbi:amino acid/polyamine transporter I [Exophiala viscosa]|uniref:Amino acid/polyamine transporter I n=1 Tax=Exophiala viscosa TaxID=2486360 RepID=A0AAN6DSH0_9EURO|nr:amino acid/polyamine transporter I [Exophiala viscosa]KAI1623115.1 amino acid/polyamine transporter I [Exophiala viscosa]